MTCCVSILRFLCGCLHAPRGNGFGAIASTVVVRIAAAALPPGLTPWDERQTRDLVFFVCLIASPAHSPDPGADSVHLKGTVRLLP